MRLPSATHLLLGFAGPRAEAEEIKRRLAEFLRDDLKLELSPDKTLVTHGRSQAARFLDYEVVVFHDDAKRWHKQRSIDAKIGLRVPMDVVKAKCSPTSGTANQSTAENGATIAISASWRNTRRSIGASCSITSWLTTSTVSLD